MMRLRVGHRKEKKEEREGCNSQETPPFNRAQRNKNMGKNESIGTKY